MSDIDSPASSRKRLSIWIVHPTAGGPSIGRHWRPYWLAESWQRMGHDATVVCANFHHLMHGPRRSPGPHKIEDVNFWFVGTTRYRGNGPGRLISMLSFRLRLARDLKELLKSRPPDVIIASIPHLFHVQVLRKLADRLKIPFWVEVRDLWPLSLTALMAWSGWNPIIWLISLQEKRAYRAADQLISLLASAEKYMLNAGLRPGRFSWIPNGVSGEDISSALTQTKSDHPLVRHVLELKAAGKQVVLYAGAMGPPNALEVLVEAAAILSRPAPHVHVILLGSGTSRKKLMNKAASLGNVEFFDEVSRPIVHSALSVVDCAVLVFRQSDLYAHGISPNKLFEYCLCAPRTAIACDQTSLLGLEDLVTNRCNPEDPAALAKSITQALRELPRSPDDRIAAVSRFSYSKLALQYLKPIT